MKKKYITASEFDQKFDDGEDITEYLDLDNASRPGRSSKPITVDFPEWMVKDLDRISGKRGLSRENMIKTFVWEKLKELEKG